VRCAVLCAAAAKALAKEKEERDREREREKERETERSSAAPAPAPAAAPKPPAASLYPPFPGAPAQGAPLFRPPMPMPTPAASAAPASAAPAPSSGVMNPARAAMNGLAPVAPGSAVPAPAPAPAPVPVPGPSVLLPGFNAPPVPGPLPGVLPPGAMMPGAMMPGAMMPGGMMPGGAVPNPAQAAMFAAMQQQLMPPLAAEGHAPPPADQPAPKKAKVAAVKVALIAEDEFLATNPPTVVLKVVVPNDSKFAEFNFNGQTVDVTFELKDTVHPFPPLPFVCVCGRILTTLSCSCASGGCGQEQAETGAERHAATKDETELRRWFVLEQRRQDSGVLQHQIRRSAARRRQRACGPQEKRKVKRLRRVLLLCGLFLSNLDASFLGAGSPQSNTRSYISRQSGRPARAKEFWFILLGGSS
jgi:hypothetical protein